MTSANDFFDIDDVDYPLLESQIAKFPIYPRHNSKLLVYNEEKEIKNDIFYNIDDYLPSSSLLILNNSKTIPARLLFPCQQSIIQIFCLRGFEEKGIEKLLIETQKVNIVALVGNLKKWKNGELVQEMSIDNNLIRLTATLLYKIENTQNQFAVLLSWNDTKINFGKILDLFGKLPLPPYLKRETIDSDRENYQTVFSSQEGSVATPTAGLHFTQELLKKIQTKNIITDYITLHVGSDTFKPIYEKNIFEHKMHGENIVVFKQNILQLLKFYPAIFAVGTTSLRTLESLYFLGNNIYLKEKNFTQVEQNPSNANTLTFIQSLQIILEEMDKQNIHSISFNTALMIHANYKIKSIQGLVTNFHQPKSTLLLIIRSLVGQNWKKIYKHASNQGYRFLSFGDGCLLFKQN